MSKAALFNIVAALIVAYWFKGFIIMVVVIIARTLKRLYYRGKPMLYHYVEYKIGGEIYNTGDRPINDLEGVGLINEIENRGGLILCHQVGSAGEIRDFINWRDRKAAELRSQRRDLKAWNQLFGK